MPTINLLDLWSIAVRHWKRFLIGSLALGLAGYGVSFFIPPAYRATAVILPPQEDELAASSLIAQRSFAGLGLMGRFGSYFTPADVAIAILRSRSIHEKVAAATDYQRIYRLKSVDDAVRSLQSKVKSRISNDGTISVTTEDCSAERAAEIANLFIENLDDYNQRFRSFRARRTRVFLEERVALIDSSLRTSETALAAYQRTKGTVVIPSESAGAAGAAVELMSQKLAAEVELELLKSYSSPQSDEVLRAENRVRELRRQVGDLPAALVGGANLIREVAVYQQVFTFLTAQLEQFRIREAMDTPTIQVLDEARPATRRYWPRRLWIAAFGAVLGIALVGGEVAGLFRRMIPARES